MLVARRKAAIATLPPALPQPRPPQGSLNLGDWTYVFDPVGGNRWIKKRIINDHVSKFRENGAQLMNGAGVSDPTNRDRYSNNAVEIIVDNKFYSIGDADDEYGRIVTNVVVLGRNGKWLVVSRHPRYDVAINAAAAIGSVIYTACSCYDEEYDRYGSDDGIIRTLDVSTDPPVWGEILDVPMITDMFRSGDCIVTVGHVSEALGVICGDVWTPLLPRFPGEKITNFEWSDNIISRDEEFRTSPCRNR